MKYIFRKSSFEDEKEYSLEDDYLLINKIIKVEYKDIKSVRLYYNPTRINPNMYETIIHTANKKYIIKNMHYISMANFEDRSQEYYNFIKELHLKLQNYDICFTSGVSKISYFSQLLLVAFTLYIVFKVLLSFGASTGLIVVKLLFFGYLLYLGYKYFKKNYPKKYIPDNIPIDSLPKSLE